MFWGSLILTSLHRLLISGMLNVSFDEGYYFYWSLFPQLSYFDHPPLTSWAMWLSGQFFDDSVWRIRFWPVASGFALAFIGRRLASEMFDLRAGNFSGTMLLLAPVFMSNEFVMTPDTLFVPLWAATVLFTWYAIEDKRNPSPWWYAVGICAGLAGLSKYTMIIFFFGIGLLILYNPRWRKQLLWGGLIGGVISLLICSPVILWNYQHDWISFRFQLSHDSATSKHSLFKNIPFYASGLMLIVTPLLSLYIFRTCAIGAFCNDSRRRFLATFFWAVIIFFGYFSFTTKIQANWPMVAFFTGIIALAGDWSSYKPLFRRLALGLLFATDVVVMIWLLLPAQFPLMLFGKQLDPSRLKEFYQAETVASIVSNNAREIGASAIVAQSHQMFGTLAFYAPETRGILCPTFKNLKRFPWLNAKKCEGNNVLWAGNRELTSEDKKQFSVVHYLGKFNIPIKQNLNRAVYLYSGENYKPISETPIDQLID